MVAASSAASCRLPSPMSNPGLTPEWAKVILDCHRKRFVDECAICFSEILHNFRLHDTVAAGGDTADDVVSCGTSESEHSGGTAPRLCLHACTPYTVALRLPVPLRLLRRHLPQWRKFLCAPGCCGVGARLCSGVCLHAAGVAWSVVCISGAFCECFTNDLRFRGVAAYELPGSCAVTAFTAAMVTP